MTVGELKKKLKDIPDDLLIVSYQSDMEKSGIMKAYPSCKIIKCKEVERKTWDRFDGENYTYKTYKEDNDGDIELFEI